MSSGLIIDKNCSIKEVALKKYMEEDLYKKCGFKKADGFGSHAQWKIKMNGLEYIVRLFGKTTGRANHENKYDFPPPADNYLFFGLKASRHTTIFCFSIAFWPTDRNLTRRRAANGDPPSCLISVWWPKSDRKEANHGVAARLQCEI